MKYCLALVLLASQPCPAQGWELEIMTGLSGYGGDLTQKVWSPQTMGFANAVNVRYNFDDLFTLRGGLVAGSIRGHDKYNSRPDLKTRNLDFRSDIIELNLCGEFNLFEPEFFFAYPYVFAGIGVFHFNPYTYDRQSAKTFLQPLGTEGQGLPDYPARRPYRLTQLCVPVGGGIRVTVSRRCDLVYELAGRVLFTDYLDDVSTTYVNRQALIANSRPKAAELAFKQRTGPYPAEGDRRGNPKIKDWYYITGLKLLVRLDR